MLYNSVSRGFRSSDISACILRVYSSPTDEVHVDFPLHFRYQAPSGSELYRQASVVAPDMFVFCSNGDESAATRPKTLEDGAVQSYFQVRRHLCRVKH
jgi:hypothetical protein